MAYRCRREMRPVWSSRATFCTAGIEIEERQQLGDFTLRFSRLPGKIPLGVIVRVAEPGQGVGQIVGVHVEPLPVLDDLVQQDLVLLRRLHPAGDFGKSRFARGMVAALAGDNPVNVLRLDVADGNGLEDAEPLHRRVEFLLGLGVEAATGLIGVGADAVAGNGKCPAQPPAAVERTCRGACSSASGNEGFSLNVASAARRAASTTPMDAPLDFCEEAAGDAGFDAGWGMEGDGNTVGDRFLVACQVGDDRVKRQGPKMLPQLGKVAALVCPGPLETRHEIAEQGQVRVVAGTDVVYGGRDLHDALGTPIGGLQGNHHEIRGAQGRKAHQRKSWRAVEDDVIVAVFELRGALPQATNAGRIAPRPSCRRGRRSPAADSRAANRHGCSAWGV